MSDHTYITTTMVNSVKDKNERELLVRFYNLKIQLYDMVQHFADTDTTIRRICIEFKKELSGHYVFDSSQLFTLVSAIKEETDLTDYRLFNSLFDDCVILRGELTGFCLPLVMSLAGKFTWINDNGNDFEDYFQEGLTGLLRAIDMFNPTKHTVKLNTYAYLKIKVMMQRYRDNITSTIRKPIHFKTISDKINGFVAKYSVKHGNRPSIDTIVNETNIREENVKLVFIHNMNNFDIDGSITAEGTSTWHDVIEDVGAEDEIFSHLKSQEVHRILEQLLPRHRKVLRMYFGIGYDEMTLQEIGDEIGLTRTRIRNIRDQGLRIFYGILDTEAHMALFQDDLIPLNDKLRPKMVADDMKLYYQQSSTKTQYN